MGLNKQWRAACLFHLNMTCLPVGAVALTGRHAPHLLASPWVPPWVPPCVSVAVPDATLWAAADCMCGWKAGVWGKLGQLDAQCRSLECRRRLQLRRTAALAMALERWPHPSSLQRLVRPSAQLPTWARAENPPFSTPPPPCLASADWMREASLGVMGVLPDILAGSVTLRPRHSGEGQGRKRVLWRNPAWPHTGNTHSGHSRLQAAAGPGAASRFNILSLKRLISHVRNMHVHTPSSSRHSHRLLLTGHSARQQADEVGSCITVSLAHFSYVS